MLHQLEFNLLSRILSSLYILVLAIAILIYMSNNHYIIDVSSTSAWTPATGHGHYVISYDNEEHNTKNAKMAILGIVLIIFAILNFFLAEYTIYVWLIASCFYGFVLLSLLYNLIKKLF